MADYYSEFSEIIEDLPPEAAAWVREVMIIIPDEGSEAEARLKGLLSLEGDGVDLGNWPHFAYALEEGKDGRFNLWLHADDVFTEDHLITFVRELICRFMPDYVFKVTGSSTCSKPRIGEFGGWWLVISKDEVLGGDSWSEAGKLVRALRTGDIGPEIDDEGEPVITAHEAKLALAAAKEGFWLTVGGASLHIKNGDDGVSVSVYRLDHESEDSIAETWAAHSELENS